MSSRASQKWWALVAILLAVLVVSMDGTILSIAVPTLAVELHANESQLQWFSSGYFLVLAASVLPAGRIGDRFGRKRTLVAAVAVFGLGSIACAFSTDPTEFLVARLVMGLAGGPITVMAMAAITTLFSEEERPKAVGFFAAANFLSLPIGPILGGWMLTNFWWGWVFLINAPVALIGVVATLLLVPESRATRAPRFDPVGIAISAVSLVSLTYGFIRAGEQGWDDPPALALIAGGILVFIGFVLWERLLARRGGEPLLDLSLLAQPTLLWGAVLSGVAALTMIGVIFVMPQFFQGVQGTTAIDSGLRLLPMLAGLVAGAIGAERMARLAGWKATTAAGFAVILVGVVLGTQTRSGSSMVFIAAWMAVYGLGLGLTTATASSAALSRLNEEDGATGSAMVQLVQKLAAPLGSAVLGSIVSAVYVARLALPSLPATVADAAHGSVFAGRAVAEKLASPLVLSQVQDAFSSGLAVCLLVCAAIAAVGGILALVFLPARSGPARDTPYPEKLPSHA